MRAFARVIGCYADAASACLEGVTKESTGCDRFEKHAPMDLIPGDGLI